MTCGSLVDGSATTHVAADPAEDRVDDARQLRAVVRNIASYTADIADSLTYSTRPSQSRIWSSI